MKKLTTIIGILVLIGALAVPVMAWGPHWGRGHHMMGYGGSGPGYGRGDYGNLTSEQKSKLDTLDRTFYEETRDLRDKIWTKSGELDRVLNNADPDLDKARELQKEISVLRAKVDEKNVAYEVEVRKIVPDKRPGYGYGNWHGRHMGPHGHMMGYGPGARYDRFRGGYGPGNCWN